MRFPLFRFALVFYIIFFLILMGAVFLSCGQPFCFSIAVVVIGDLEILFLGDVTAYGNPGLNRPKRFTLRRCVRMAWLLAGLLLLQLTLAAMWSSYMHWMTGAHPLPDSERPPEARGKFPSDASILWYGLVEDSIQWWIALAIWGLMTGLIWHRIRPLPSGASPMAPPPKPP